MYQSLLVSEEQRLFFEISLSDTLLSVAAEAPPDRKECRLYLFFSISTFEMCSGNVSLAVLYEILYFPFTTCPLLVLNNRQIRKLSGLSVSDDNNMYFLSQSTGQ